MQGILQDLMNLYLNQKHDTFIPPPFFLNFYLFSTCTLECCDLIHSVPDTIQGSSHVCGITTKGMFPFGECLFMKSFLIFSSSIYPSFL